MNFFTTINFGLGRYVDSWHEYIDNKYSVKFSMLKKISIE